MSIKPALTAEEWTKALPKPEAYEMYVGDTPEIRHYLAALNLVGQPFGFTRRDVDAIRIAAESANTPAHYEALHDLADRIEALLPPEASA